MFRESVTPESENHFQDSIIIEAIEDLGLVHAMVEVKDENPLAFKKHLPKWKEHER